jgi:sugar lactone lactonase YvrE
MSAELALRFNAEVGEGPLWDNDSQELIFIDVTQGDIHRFNPLNGRLSSLKIGMHIGAVGLMDRERYIAAVRDGFATINRSSGEISYIKRVLDDEGIRFNDGKCDPFGKFIAGTMRYEPKMGTAQLYSLDSSGVTKSLLTGVGLSNGLCWSVTGKQLFYIDTLTRQIALFHYDHELGIVGEREVLYEFNKESGSPDGMTIDVEGNLWVALWGGARVSKISPQGLLISELHLPVSQPTSVIFGGTNFEKLFITSARYRLSEASMASEPLAGSVFVADVGVSGREEAKFSLSR